VRSATVAIEDARFYKHHGVDFEGIVRAAMKNIQNRKTVQGGSTITQQLVRALYIKDPRRDFKRKIREPSSRRELEDEHPKSWILTSYLKQRPVRHREWRNCGRHRGGGRRSSSPSTPRT